MPKDEIEQHTQHQALEVFKRNAIETVLTTAGEMVQGDLMRAGFDTSDPVTAIIDAYRLLSGGEHSLDLAQRSVLLTAKRAVRGAASISRLTGEGLVKTQDEVICLMDAFLFQGASGHKVEAYIREGKSAETISAAYLLREELDDESISASLDVIMACHNSGEISLSLYENVSDAMEDLIISGRIKTINIPGVSTHKTILDGRDDVEHDPGMEAFIKGYLTEEIDDSTHEQLASQ